MAEAKVAQFIKLNSLQLLEDVSIAYGSENGPKTAKASKKELEADPNAIGKQYRTILFDGTAFNIDETTFQLLQAGKLASMKLEVSSRPVTLTDDQGNEEVKNIRQFSFVKAVSKEAMLATKIYDAKINDIDKMVANDTGLDAEKIARLEAMSI